VVITIAICSNCRAEIPDSELAIAVRAGENLRCEQCGTIFVTDGVMRDVDKAVDDFRKSFPKKFDINIKF
jgi:DNA-directed RNA polymerase subunit RPC12/RpoP